jgi:hypothetical protein
MTWMAINGDQMEVPATQGVRYFDFYHGAELKPDVRDAGHSLIRFPIEAKAYGAVLATHGELRPCAKITAHSVVKLSQYN